MCVCVSVDVYVRKCRCVHKCKCVEECRCVCA